MELDFSHAFEMTVKELRPSSRRSKEERSSKLDDFNYGTGFLSRISGLRCVRNDGEEASYGRHLDDRRRRDLTS